MPAPAGALPASQRDLFGGAMAAPIPDDFDNISVIRDVPDNQEVFSHGQTDRSIIIELVEIPEEPEERQKLPAAFHIDALASDSSAISAQTHSAVDLPATAAPLLANDDRAISVSIANATHTVSKFRDDSSLASRVSVTMAVARLPRASTDVLITFNEPVALHPEGSSARAGAVIAPAPSIAEPTVRACLADIILRDWGLLG